MKTNTDDRGWRAAGLAGLSALGLRQSLAGAGATAYVICLLLLTIPTTFAVEVAIDPERASSLIILDDTGMRNLRIETVEVEEQDFESTVFAIGRIEEIPANRSVLSSRISGRAIKVNAFEGDRVEEGQVLVEVESRQPGNPPPTIPLRANQAGLVIASHVRVGEPVEPNVEPPPSSAPPAP